MAQKSASDFDFHSGMVNKSEQSGSSNSAKPTVNLYTGSPSYNIPLFNLEKGDLSIPVSINYGSSGIRAGEIEGPMGLGWSNSMHASITREVRGLPDESPGGYLFHANVIQQDLQSINKSAKIDLVSKAMDKDYDTHPDVFHFSFLGHSGSFVFNSNGEIVCMPHNNYQISKTVVSNKIIGFKIITDDGKEFYFGKDPLSTDVDKENFIEETKITTLEVPTKFVWVEVNKPMDLKLNFADAKESTFANGYFNSGWFLNHITTPTGGYAKYKYFKVAQSHVERPNVFSYELCTKNVFEYGEARGFNFYYSGLMQKLYRKFDPMVKNSYFSNQWTSPYKVEEHGRHKETVTTFNDLLERMSAPSDGFEVKEPKNMYYTQNLIQKKNIYLSEIKLQNVGHISCYYREYTINSSKHKFVSEVGLYDNSNNLVKEYNFQHDKVTSSYRSANENLYKNDPFSMLEAVVFYKLLNQQGKPHTPGYASNYFNDVSIANKGLVEKYIFEGMKDGYYNRVFLKSFNNSKGEEYSFDYLNKGMLPRRTTVAADMLGYPNKSNIFKATLGVYVSDEMEISYFSGTRNGLLNKIILPTKGYYAIEYEHIGRKYSVSQVKTYDKNDDFLGVKKYKYENSVTRGNITNKYSLPFYDVRGYKKNSYYISASNTVGGIQNNFIQGSPVAYQHVSVFNYKDEQLTQHNGHEHYRFTWQLHPSTIENSDQYSGASYKYPKIEKLYIGRLAFYNEALACFGSAKVDWEDYCEASFSSDFHKTTTTYPKKSIPNMDYCNGHIRLHQVFNASGDKLKESKTTYEFVANETVQGVKGNKYFFANNSAYKSIDLCTQKKKRIKGSNRDEYSLVSYLNVSGTFRVKDVTEKAYDINKCIDNKCDSIVSFSEMVYNDYNYISSKTTTLPNGDKQILNYNYAFDYSFDQQERYSQYKRILTPEFVLFSQMKENNMIKNPVATFTQIQENNINWVSTASINLYANIHGNILLSKSMNYINIDESSEDYFIPYTKYNYLYYDKRLEETKTMDKYDEHGNILEYHSKDNIYNVVLWGYYNTLPIANINNAKYEDIEAIFGQNIDFGSGTLSVQQETLLRSSLPNASITTYEHLPFVGVTRQTDVNGISTYTSYDKAGRVEYVKDNNKHIISKFRYHY